MSPRSVTETEMAKPKPKTGGRPRTHPDDMNERIQIRCTALDLEKWKERASALGYGSVAAWIRKAANDAFLKPVR